MVPRHFLGLIWEDDPPFMPGDFLVVLDTRGQLLEFVAQPSTDAKTPVAANWNAMLEEAGIPLDRISEKDPDWVPPVPCDSRRSWQVRDSSSELTYNIAAAWFNNKPVFFHVAPAEPKPGAAGEPRFQWLGNLFFASANLTILCGGIYLARRNLRRGRGDRKGALRVAGFIFACGFIAWLFSAHHVASGYDEYQMFIGGIGAAIYWASFFWVLYLAVEPYVRQRWPEMLISWTRVLSGQVRDTRVGRDMLIGAIAGGMLAVLHLLVTALPRWINITNIDPLPSSGLGLRGASAFLSFIGYQALIAVLWALGLIAFLLLAKVVMRNFGVALAFVVVTTWPLFLPAENLPIGVTAALLTTVTGAFLLLRYGLLSLVINMFFLSVLRFAPLTFDFSRWYAWRSLFALAVLASVAVFAFVAVLGGRPLLHPELDEP